MVKTSTYVLTLVVMILIVGAGIYWYNVQSEQIKKDFESSKQKIQTPEEKLLLEKYNATLSPPYEIVMVEDYEGTKIKKEIVYNQDIKKIIKDFGLFSLEAYYKDNLTILCLNDIKKQKTCAMIEDKNSSNYYLAENLKADLEFLPTKTEKEIITYFLVDGIMNITSKIKKEQKNGFNCSMLGYNMDYRKIRFDKVNELGLNLSASGVGYLKQINISECIDENTKISVYKEMNYTNMIDDRITKYSFEILNLTLNPQQISLPNLTSDSSIVEQKIVYLDSMAEKLNSCLQQTTANENCYFLQAIDYSEPILCELTQNKTSKEQCYEKYALRKGQVQYCDNAGEQKDECLINYVYIYKEQKNIGYCDLIKNESLKTQCINIFNATSTDNKSNATG
jgi:hypothetical protein